MMLTNSQTPPVAPRVAPQLTWLDPALTDRNEPSLLGAREQSAWVGLRVDIFRAQTQEQSAIHGQFPALGMILKGRTHAQIMSRGVRSDFSPGPDSVGLFAPYFDIDWKRWDCEDGAERMMVELDLSSLEQQGDIDMLRQSGSGLKQDVTLRDPGLAALMRLIAQEIRCGSPTGPLYATSLSLALVAAVYKHSACAGPASTRERGQLTGPQQRRVLALIRERLAQDIRLEDLAQAAGVSRFHFLRLFKNSMGMTPHRYLMTQRVEAARQRLDRSDDSLADIAAATGFSSQSHLCNTMRRELGLTPGQWRRETRIAQDSAATVL